MILLWKCVIVHYKKITGKAPSNSLAARSQMYLHQPANLSRPSGRQALLDAAFVTRGRGEGEQLTWHCRVMSIEFSALKTG